MPIITMVAALGIETATGKGIGIERETEAVMTGTGIAISETVIEKEIVKNIIGSHCKGRLSGPKRTLRCWKRV